MFIKQKLHSPSNLISGGLLFTFTLFIAAVKVFDVVLLPLSTPTLF